MRWASFKQGDILTIRGKKYELLGMARYFTRDRGGFYYKVELSGGKVLLGSGRGAPCLGEILPEGENGILPLDGAKEIVFRGEKWQKTEADYQFVERRFFGKPETECYFVNYAAPDGKRELSLGVISEDGRRADVLCDELTAKDVLPTQHLRKLWA